MISPGQSPPEPDIAAANTAMEPVRQRYLISLARKIASFVLAGGIGFVVDLAVTLALLSAGVGRLPARAGGIIVAMSVTYALNRTVTFRAAKSTAGRAEAAEGLRYAVVGIATSVLNWSVYAAVLWLVPSLWPAAAICLGSFAAMIVSYTGYDRLVFRG